MGTQEDLTHPVSTRRITCQFAHHPCTRTVLGVQSVVDGIPRHNNRCRFPRRPQRVERLDTGVVDGVTLQPPKPHACVGVGDNETQAGLSVAARSARLLGHILVAVDHPIVDRPPHAWMVQCRPRRCGRHHDQRHAPSRLELLVARVPLRVLHVRVVLDRIVRDPVMGKH